MTELAFGTPRKLPKAEALVGRVVVLDIAFCGAAGGGFESVTQRLIHGLGERLAGWIDHHDHERHSEYADDPRFVLATKAQHGACPEMISPELVARVGPVDTVLCHTDFDGLASAAKWLRGGTEPYPGCDRDAHAIDTRIGEPSEVGLRVDRALRARPHDRELSKRVVRYLAGGLKDEEAARRVEEAAAELVPIERETRRAAERFRRYDRRGGGGVAYVDVSTGYGRLDKTELLLLGQRLEQVAVVVDQQNVALAAPFDSGIDFLKLLGLEGGMPTRVSVPKKQHDEVMSRLGVDFV